MAVLYDAMGNAIGDDGAGDLYDWTDNALDPNIGIDQTLAPADVGYFDRKISEFQSVLNAVDFTANRLETLLITELSDADVYRIQDLLTEYYDRRVAFRFAAEAFNAISATVNSVGGNMPALSIPAGLGFAPMVIPVAWAAAVAGAAVLVSFGLGWINRSSETATDIAMKIADPVKRDEALKKAAEITAKKNAAGTIGQAADIVKWIAIGGAALLVLNLMTR